MKTFLAILALFCAMIMAQAQVQSQNNYNNSDNNNGNEPARWFNYPHPYNRHSPKPPHGHHFDHARKKCLKAIHDPDFAACQNDYIQFLHTHKPKISSDCCSALENISAHCPILKKRHPGIGKILKHHCPAPPTPSPSGH